MFNFPTFTQKDSPAANAHIQSQFSMVSDLSKQMFNAVQKVNELNIQVTQRLLDEAISNTQQILSSKDATEALSVIAEQAQPSVEKIRMYQQHLIDIATNTQVDIMKAAETHIPEASRTAQDLAKEVARKAAEETEQVTQRQKTAIEKMTAPAARAEGAKGGQPKPATH